MSTKIEQTDMWLLQTYDNGEFFLYKWTPILAAKKNMKVITKEQAQPLLQLTNEKRNNVKFVKNPGKLFADREELIELIPVTPKAEEKVQDNDDNNTRDIVKNVVKTSENDNEPRNLDDVRDISVSQEDIMAAELKAIASFKHKSSLEKHMLEKYQIEVPQGRFTMMKAHANKMITDLAKENRLYMVDGLIEA